MLGGMPARPVGLVVAAGYTSTAAPRASARRMFSGHAGTVPYGVISPGDRHLEHEVVGELEELALGPEVVVERLART